MKREIELFLSTLAHGGRILRLSDLPSNRLDPQESVSGQKERCQQVLVAARKRELGTVG
jgi:hypothetical protein